MKKLTGVFICLLLFTFISSARIIEVADAGITDKLKAVIAAKNAGGAPPSGCTPDSGDNYNQDFETGSEPTNWSNTNSPDYGATPPATDPGSNCTYALHVTAAAAAETATWTKPVSPLADTYWIRFYIYIVSGDFTGNEIIWENPSANLTIYDSSGLSFRLSSGGGNSNFISTTAGEWHRIDIEIIKGGNSYFYHDGTKSDVMTANNSATETLVFGTSLAKTMSVYYDEIAYSESGLIGAP